MPSKYSDKLLEKLEKEELLRKQEQVDLGYASEIIRIKASTEAQIRLQGLQDYYAMRRVWGNFLRKCLMVILAFNILLIIFVGLGVLTYNDEWFLRIVLTTNLADIIGLVYLVVKFLFSNQVEEKDKTKLR